MHDSYERAARQNPHDRSFGDVLSDLFRDGADLIRQEVELAKTEMRENVSRIVRDSVGLIVGGVIAFVGLQALIAAAILGLAQIMPAWAAALVVGGALALIGLFMVMANMRGIRETGMAPRRTMETIREDARMVKEKFS